MIGRAFALSVEQRRYGRELSGHERMLVLAAQFALEFGPLLNVLDFT